MSALHPLFLVAHLSQFTPIGFVPKCSVYDSECLTTLVQGYTPAFFNGLPGLGVNDLDPVSVVPLKYKDDSFEIEWKKIELRGLKQTIIEQAEINKFEKRARIRMHVPRLSLLSNFTSKGFLRELEYNREGQALLNFYDFINDITISYDIIKGKDGKQYFEAKDFYYWFNFRDMDLVLDYVNTPDPVKVVRDIEYSRQNYKILWQQYGRPIFTPIIEKVFKAMNNFLRLRSLEDSLIDY